MTTAVENELLTRVGPGTPMGELMREYWIPAAMSHELKADGDPMRLMLLGEKLVAFRDSEGRTGIFDHRCPHRRASFFFGRNEAGGIRCVYHGWKFSSSGECVDLPSEPADIPMKGRIRIRAYPTVERGGVVWTYMGPPDKRPPLPEWEFATVPDDQRFVSKRIQELEAMVGGKNA